MITETVYLSNIKMTIDYLVGKNAQDNFDIIDMASGNDLWFHLEGVSSCHVVAILPEDESFNKKQLQTIAKHGALLCKQHSPKYSSIHNLPVIYTKIEHVTKTTPVGSVLPINTKRILV